jgi:hypothetical protein
MGWWKWCGNVGLLRVVVTAGSVHLVTGTMTAATIVGALCQEKRKREKEKTSAQIQNFSIFGFLIPYAPDGRFPGLPYPICCPLFPCGPDDRETVRFDDHGPDDRETVKTEGTLCLWMIGETVSVYDLVEGQIRFLVVLVPNRMGLCFRQET